MAKTIILADRGVLAVGGEDRRSFLQGLISNDVAKAGPSRAIYSAFLTPQGKFLHDFFLVEHGDHLLLECEGARAGDLKRRLSLYRLRARTAIEDAGNAWAVGAIIGDDALTVLGLPNEPGTARSLGAGVVYVDPRLARLGARFILPRPEAEGTLADLGFPAGEEAEYDALRLDLGVPDGSRDIEVEKAILLECGFEELNGLDWQKGCYMGQELTARTKYRGLVKKRLMPVVIEGPAPDPGSRIQLGDRDAGEMRSSRNGRGLALVRLDAWAEAAAGNGRLVCGDSVLHAEKPDWATF